MNKAQSKLPATGTRVYGLAIKQERGKVTYDALIDAGFKMLEEHDLQDICIAELAREAGYSVGAFYARFRSKDEFFDALVAKHLQIRTSTHIHLFSTLSMEKLLEELIPNVLNYYWQHRKFWRAVLMRSLRDPGFWKSIYDHGHEFSGRFMERMKEEIGRPLDATEEENITFAFQVLLSTINSNIINQPGPVLTGQNAFIEKMTRAFSLISGFDNFVKLSKQARSAQS